MSEWQNADGLTVKYGVDKPTNHQYGGEVVQNGSRHTLTFRFDYEALTGFTTDLNNDGTRNGFSLQDAGVPAGASIEAVKLKIGTAWAGGTSLYAGAYEIDGTVIDADGFITTTAGAVANLTEGSIVDGDGAFIGEQVDGTNAGYAVVAAAGTFTAGTAALIIDYII